MSVELSVFKNVLISILLEAIPFVLLGVVLAALLQMFVTEEMVRRWMPSKPVWGILFGTGLGLLFPICECGMIPVIRRLMQKGMPPYIAVVFIISGPILNPIVFISTYMAFRMQPEMAYARMGLAFLVAVIIGWIVYKTVVRNPLKNGLQVELQVGPNPAIATGVMANEQSKHSEVVKVTEVHKVHESTVEVEEAQWQLIGEHVDSLDYGNQALNRVLTVNERLGLGDYEQAGDQEDQGNQEEREGQDVRDDQEYQEAQDTIEAVEERREEDVESNAGDEQHVTEAERELLFDQPVVALESKEPLWQRIRQLRWNGALVKRRLSEFLTHASLEFFEIGKYLVLGCIITATVHTFVSRDVLVAVGDGAVGSHLFMMAFAYILSICSTSDAFVASSFTMTFSSSSLLAFLVFGPMLDAKTTLMMLAVFRTKFVLYLAGLITATVLIGSLIVGAIVF